MTPGAKNMASDKDAHSKGTKKPGPSTRNDKARSLGIAVTLPFQMLAGPIAGFGMGYLLDHLLSTWPALFLVLGIGGLVAGLVSVIRTVKRAGDS